MAIFLSDILSFLDVMRLCHSDSLWASSASRMASSNMAFWRLVSNSVDTFSIVLSPVPPSRVNCIRAESARAVETVRAGRPWPASNGEQFSVEDFVVLMAKDIAGRCSLMLRYCCCVHLRSMAPIIWLALSHIAFSRPPVVI